MTAVPAHVGCIHCIGCTSFVIGTLATMTLTFVRITADRFANDILVYTFITLMLVGFVLIVIGNALVRPERLPDVLDE